jgi:RecA/RadA recombinase
METNPMAQAPDREKALELALAQIEKNHGKGSVMRLGDEVRQPISVIPTGSIALDVALGIGGLPRGRVVEIYGPESSGKTTVALHAVANAQAAGGIAAFIDAEHALDPEYAKKLGVDTDSLLVSQPDTGEQALEIADMLIRSGALDILVIDSVAALVPRAEIEGEMGDSHVGLQARLMSQALRKITGALSNSGTTAIFINQLREKIICLAEIWMRIPREMQPVNAVHFLPINHPHQGFEDLALPLNAGLTQPRINLMPGGPLMPPRIGNQSLPPPDLKNLKSGMLQYPVTGNTVPAVPPGNLVQPLEEERGWGVTEIPPVILHPNLQHEFTKNQRLNLKN